jgi:hypothetical protein
MGMGIHGQGAVGNLLGDDVYKGHTFDDPLIITLGR